MNLQDMKTEVVQWVGPLLPERHPMDTGIKMMEELGELLHAINVGEGVGPEAADVLILLVDIAHLTGIDLEAEFEKKMAINRTRTWVANSKGSMNNADAD